MGKEKSALPEANSDKELAADFFKYFNEKNLNIRSKIEQEQRDNHLPNYNCAECQFHGERMTNFTLLDESDFSKLISDMSNKFCCLDLLPTWLLKECLEELGPILLKLVNLSLQFGVFPSAAKTAAIKPSIKDFKESTDAHSNYRPVSNIPYLSKLIEKAVLKQINGHLFKNNLICNSQSGYRQYHSCETLNIKMFDDMLKSIDEGSTVGRIQLTILCCYNN